VPSEYITLREAAKLASVSEDRVKNMFSMGGAFALVPRRRDAKGNLIVYRKDFMPHLEKKLEKDSQYSKTSQKLWDLHFATSDIYDSSN
jgi:hypothetical protein